MRQMNGTAPIRIKRAYEDRSPGDGRRVLVDRMWPRGVRKADLKDAVWLKDVAPSAQLRKWFGHKPERWAEFRSRYLAELRANPALEVLRQLVGSDGPVTLIYGARDRLHNQAVVLAEVLQGGTDEHPAASARRRDDAPSRAPRPAVGDRA